MTTFTCEYNPMMPCPFNDGEDNCTAEDVELVLAPYGWLRCDTRFWYEARKDKAGDVQREDSTLDY